MVSVKRSPLRRTPMKRGPSQRQQARIEARRETRARLLAAAPGCAVRLAGGPGLCYGPLTHHHVLPVARGGSDGLDNAAAVCLEHNRMLSQDAATMRWGYANGLLKR